MATLLEPAGLAGCELSLDLIPLGAMVVDEQLRIVQWNRTLSDWTGVGRAQAVGQRLIDLYESLAGGPYERRLREIFQTGLPVFFSATLHRHFLPIPPQRGLPIPRMIQRTEARLMPGDRNRALITIQDVSVQYHHLDELKAERLQLLQTQEQMSQANHSLEEANRLLTQAQETLQDSREYTDSILRSMADMLVVLSPTGHIERINAATLEQLNYPAEELLGQPAQILFADALIPSEEQDNKSNAPTQTRLLQQLSQDTCVRDFETYCITRSGTRLPVNLSGAPLSNSRGEQLGYVCVLQNTADRLRIQSELARAQRLKSVGQLAAGIAHEINTPLQCISSSVEYLEMEFPSLMEVIDEYAELADRNPSGGACPVKLRRARAARQEAPAALADATTAVRRVCEVIGAMRSTTYPGGKQCDQTDINQLVHDAVTVSRGRWKACATVELQLDPQLPYPRTMPAEISQVLINLLVNAGDAVSQHAQPGKTTGRIEVKTYVQDQAVVIEVSDNGPGVPAEVRDRIFEPFFTTKPIGQGTGQGLAFSYQAVTQLGGTLQLQSPPDGGARFRVQLPIAGSPSCPPTGN